MIYVIADTHFNDNSIIKFTGRPFCDAEEMEYVIMQNWNKTVKLDDTVFVLGDFFKKTNSKSVYILDILENLNGTKHLILGNHDREISEDIGFWRVHGFDEIYKYPIIIDNFYILSHEPLFINSSMPYVNIHGHIHEKNYDHPQYVNVSVEQIDYTPVSLDSIKNKFKG